MNTCILYYLHYTLLLVDVGSMNVRRADADTDKIFWIEGNECVTRMFYKPSVPGVMGPATSRAGSGPEF